MWLKPLTGVANLNPHLVLQVSKETGRAAEEVQEEASAILEEMAQCLQLSTVRFFAFTLSKIFKTLFRSICVNEDGIQRVNTHGDVAGYRPRTLAHPETRVVFCSVFLAPTGDPGVPCGPVTQPPQLHGLPAHVVHPIHV